MIEFYDGSLGIISVVAVIALSFAAIVLALIAIEARRDYYSAKNETARVMNAALKLYEQADREGHDRRGWNDAELRMKFCTECNGTGALIDEDIDRIIVCPVCLGEGILS